VGGYYLAIVGGFYAVLLGLIVFAAMDKFSKAESTVEDENRSILAIHMLAGQFGSEGKHLKEKLRLYIDEVINNELRLMESDQISLKARGLFLDSMDIIKKFEPTTENQKALYPVMVSEAISLWDSRRERTKTTNFTIPIAEWAILIVGAIITIAFTLFFTIESQAIHVVMTGMITIIIMTALYLVLLFGDPFSGDLKISNSTYIITQKIMDERR
jgi:xanthine/uracil permease